MNSIIEAWVSPSRKEIYAHSAIDLSTSPWYVEHLDYFLDGDVFECFDENEQKGLWKIVVEVKMITHYDSWNGDYDVDINLERILYKSKCKNFSQLREVWEQFKLDDPERYEKTIQLKG